jgi:hypothetical protein
MTNQTKKHDALINTNYLTKLINKVIGGKNIMTLIQKN